MKEITKIVAEVKPRALLIAESGRRTNRIAMAIVQPCHNQGSMWTLTRSAPKKKSTVKVRSAAKPTAPRRHPPMFLSFSTSRILGNTLYCIGDDLQCARKLSRCKDESEATMGSGSHCVRSHSVAQRSLRQTSIWLLHCAQASHYSRCHLLGVESLSGGTAGLDMGVHHRGNASEPVLANPNAPSPVAANRFWAWCSLICMVCLLACPPSS
jgi:hypothetical protein